MKVALSLLLLLLSTAAIAQDDPQWPSLNYLRRDYRESVVVAHVLGQEAAEVEDRQEVLERVHVLARRVREQAFPDLAITTILCYPHASVNPFTSVF